MVDRAEGDEIKQSLALEPQRIRLSDRILLVWINSVSYLRTSHFIQKLEGRTGELLRFPK